MPLGAPITQAITNGLGLAVEAVAARKQKKNQAAIRIIAKTTSASSTGSTETPPPSYADIVAKGKLEHNVFEDPESPDGEDEEAWALDEPQSNDLEQPASQPNHVKHNIDGHPKIEALASAVLAKCAPIPSSIPPLAQPVIIPSRRPGSKSRGFIRAYAPVLADSGIGLDAFLSFLKNFHRASQASSVLGAIFISAIVVGLVPGVATMVTSIFVQAAVGTAIELQRLSRTNTFLDVMNKELFMPRGKFALIMSYKPGAQKALEGQQADVSEMVYKRSTKEGWKYGLKGRFAIESGKTYAEVNMPKSAPLTFPGLEKEIAVEELKKVSRTKESQKFMADYYDRRAQAIYMKNNPKTSLTLPDEHKPQFASWLSDPNDPRSNGSMITLLTGGTVNIVQARKTHQVKRAARPGAVMTPQGTMEQPPVVVQPSHWERQKTKRAMKHGVLYLMIVNMPSEEEIAVARETIRKAQGKFDKVQGKN